MNCEWPLILAHSRTSSLRPLLRRLEETFVSRLLVKGNEDPGYAYEGDFGDSGEIHARTRARIGSREDSKLEFSAPLFVAHLLAGSHFRARACISRESPKLETTRSLQKKAVVLSLSFQNSGT